jgi:hypothetical protein
VRANRAFLARAVRFLPRDMGIRQFLDIGTGIPTDSLLAACVPGNFLTISHPASDIDVEQSAELVRRLNQSMSEKVTTRDRAGVARLFDGQELVEPGLV